MGILCRRHTNAGWKQFYSQDVPLSVIVPAGKAVCVNTFLGRGLVVGRYEADIRLPITALHEPSGNPVKFDRVPLEHEAVLRLRTPLRVIR